MRQVRTGYVDAPPDVREGQMFPDETSGSLSELYSSAAAPPMVRQVRAGYVDPPPDVREGQMFPDKTSGSLSELYSSGGGVSLHFGGTFTCFVSSNTRCPPPFVGL